MTVCVNIINRNTLKNHNLAACKGTLEIQKNIQTSINQYLKNTHVNTQSLQTRRFLR